MSDTNRLANYRSHGARLEKRNEQETVWPDAPADFVLMPDERDWRPRWEILNELRDSDAQVFCPEPNSLGWEIEEFMEAAEMTHKEAELMRLKVFEQMSFQKIADEMGMPHKIKALRDWNGLRERLESLL